MDKVLLSTGKDDWETPKDFYKSQMMNFILHLTRAVRMKVRNVRSITRKTMMD